MSDFTDDLLFRPVHELAALVRSGGVSARELVQASLDRIEQINPTINAFVDVFAEDALTAADAVDPSDELPFAGVPIAIKDTRGVAAKRLTWGTKVFDSYLASADHNTVRRLKAAGFVIIGTTTMPSLGILPTTESERYGATRNPWNLARTSGGSSGGAGAAVASGMVPIAHGTDGGGSVRIPAACCGLVGLKPQRGRISHAPDAGYSVLAQDGVLTRTVGETAALLDVLSGMELGDTAWAPPPAESFAQASTREPIRQRIAMTVSSPVHGVTADAAAVEAVRQTATLLEGLGHEVIEVENPPWVGYDFVPAFTAAFSAAVAPRVELAGQLLGRPVRANDVEPLTWAIYQHCKDLDGVGLVSAEHELHRIGRELIEWVSDFDALLLPVLAEPPVPLGTINPLNNDDPMQAFARSLEFMPFTPLFNISGQPAISLPLFEQEGNLPLGVQLVGQPAAEGTLLALAAQVEAAQPRQPARIPSAISQLSAHPSSHHVVV